MPNVTKPHIENIMNMDGDGYCDYWVVVESIGEIIIWEYLEVKIDYKFFLTRCTLQKKIPELHRNKNGWQNQIWDTSLQYYTIKLLLCRNMKTNPSSEITCLGLISNHFVHVFFWPRCPIPPSTPQLKTYKRSDTWALDDHFVAR